MPIPLFLEIRLYLLPRRLDHARIFHRSRHVDLPIKLPVYRILHQLPQHPPQRLPTSRLWNDALPLDHPAKCGDGANLFVFQHAGEGGLTTGTVDHITDLKMWDRIDVPDAVMNGNHFVVQNTSITSIEQALGIANYFDSPLYGDSNATASLWANPTTNTSYLLLDMDANGTYDTGIVLDGIGHPASTMLEWSMV